MTNLIKRMSDLPSWYKLEKYSDAKYLDEIGWYRQLVIRQILMMHIAAPADRNGEVSKFAKAAALIRECPIIEEKNEIFLSRLVDEVTDEMIQKKPSYTLGVHTMTYYELFQLQCDLDEEKLDYILKCAKTQILQRDYPDWLHNGIDSSIGIDNYPLSINLSLPDSLLVKQFKQHLDTLRTNTHTEETSKQFKKANLQDWVRFGALPYIDLITWAKENKVVITHRILAEAILTDQVGGEEVIRKTVKPMVNWLFNYELHSILLAQANLKNKADKSV